MCAWSASSSATLVGSMPHKDPAEAIDLILREVPEIPVWPQLSGFRAEQMMFQYLEGLPGICIEEGRLFIDIDDPDFDAELYAFYEEYLDIEENKKDLAESRFKMGPETGRTFFRFLDAVALAPVRPRALKGQIVGPFTLLAGLKNRANRLTLFDDRLQDAIPKHLAMKAAWQIDRLKAAGCPVILFLDEPGLAGFGSSAFISISKEFVLLLLKEVVDAVHKVGAQAGVHVCANTDWSIVYDSGADIINFDAYTYFDKFCLYRDAFAGFIKNGGVIAWGMVPTLDVEALRKESAEKLADVWFERVRGLVSDETPLSAIVSQSLFTPSCGCGSLSERDAERVLGMTRRLSEMVRERHGE